MCITQSDKSKIRKKEFKVEYKILKEARQQSGVS
jgi:hypothetical protein